MQASPLDFEVEHAVCHYHGDCSLMISGSEHHTVWPENLAGIKFGGLALKSCELHLAD